MIVYYSGPSEFTHRFVSKLDLPAIRIPHSVKEAEGVLIGTPFVLFTPTYERQIIRGRMAGQTTYIPRQVASMLSNPENREHLQGVLGFGNRNFHTDYARAADDISARTGVPILGRIELDGTEDDVHNTREGLNTFWLTRQSQQKHHRNSTPN